MSANYLKLLSAMDKLPVHTDLDTLDIYCEYLLNDTSKYINYANLTNLQDYIGRMDPKLFMTNDAKMARYEFIRLYLEARISRGVVSRKMCLRYVSETVDHKYWKIIQREILNSIDPDTLKKKDIEFINDLIFAQLNTLFLHAYKAPIVRLVEDLDTNEFGKTIDDCTNAIQLFQSLLNELMKAQRRSKQDNRFNLTDANHFKAIMSEAWDRLLSESQYWRTGMQGMNNMLGGGFENGRVYNFIGATGGFKSGLLLNLMKMIKLHNKGHEHKDPNKRPTILFLSQENNIWETILRIFGIFGTTKNIKNFKPDEIMKILLVVRLSVFCRITSSVCVRPSCLPIAVLSSTIVPTSCMIWQSSWISRSSPVLSSTVTVLPQSRICVRQISMISVKRLAVRTCLSRSVC